MKLQFLNSVASQASLKSPGVFTNYSNSVKWNTFRACMRRQGEWAPDDLNDQLTSSIFEEVKITSAPNFIILCAWLTEYLIV